MVMKKDTGVLVTMIIFIILTLGLGVGEYFTAKALKEANGVLQTKKSDLASKEKDLREKTEQVGWMKEKIGYSADFDYDQLVTDLDKRLQSLVKKDDADYPTVAAGCLESEPESCLDAINQLVASAAAKNEELRNLVDERDSYEKDAEDEEEKTGAQKSNFDNEVADLTEDSRQQNEEANRKYDELNFDTQKKVEEVGVVKRDSAATNEHYREETAAARETVEQIAEVNNSLRTKIEQLTNPYFDEPDALIVYVDQQNRTVRLNIGREDGVRLLTTFSVFPADSLEKGEIKEKGTLEIVNIIGDHESEGRIVEDELTEPFAPGDLVYTPLWSTGEKLAYALDYYLDVDGDNKDDLDLMVNVINAGGAAVDAWIDKTGELRGKVTPAVNYVILSNTPIDKALDEDSNLSDEVKDKILKAHEKLLEEAQINGVRLMKLSEFLRRTNFRRGTDIARFKEPGGLDAKPEGGSVPTILNPNASAEDAAAAVKDENGGSVGEKSSSDGDSPVFRKRTPKDI